MRKILSDLKNRNIAKRLAAAERIAGSNNKPDINSLIDTLSKHPGFALKKGKTPKDCLWYTKKWLRLEWDTSFYRKIAADPYQDMCVLPDYYLDEQEYTLLTGAKAVAEAAFCNDGGQASVDVLLQIFGLEQDPKTIWIKFKTKRYGTYSDYLYANVIELPVESGSSRALAILTNGRIVEVSEEELNNSDVFIDVSR